MSPDGFVQGAMQLAFARLYNKLPVPYESVLWKQFKLGRVSAAPNMSPLIADRLMAMNQSITASESSSLCVFPHL